MPRLAWLLPAPGSAAASMRAAGHSPVSYAWNLLWSFWVFLGPVYRGSWIASALKMAVIQTLLVLEGIFLHWPWYVFLILIGVCTSTGIGGLMGRINWDKTFKLRMSHEQIRHLAATAERERIGRDLHDLLGHTLSLITLKLELSRKLFDRDPAAAKHEVVEAEEVARHALAELRSAVSGIRATDLAAEFASARLLLESSHVNLEYHSSPIELPAEVERGLSLVLREAVTNVSRHAVASTVRIELRREHGAICMEINDNGRGGLVIDGNGISGMRERTRAMGGTLDVKSPLGGGTHLRVVVPVSVLRLIEPSRVMQDLNPVQSAPGYPAV